MNAWRRAKAWFLDRSGAQEAIAPMMTHRVPRSAKWWYVFGSASLMFFSIQVVTGIIGTFQIFTTAFILAQTGGNTDPFFADQSLMFYVVYLYYRAFGKIGPAGFQMGYASALAWVLFVIILLFTLLQLWLSKRWVYYESEGK